MPRAFVFHRIFEDDDVPAAQPVVAAPDVEADLAEAERRGREEGFAAGYSSGIAEGGRLARQELDAALPAALEALRAGLAALAGETVGIGRRLEEDAAQVTVVLIRKLAPRLIEAGAEAEIEALVADAFSKAVTSPGLVIQVAEALVPRLQALLPELAAGAGFTGSVTLSGDPGMQPGAVTIDWDGGGLTRDLDEIDQVIEQALQTTLRSLSKRQ